MAEAQPRVLVVDDERFFREAIVEALAEAGVECEAVESGAQALEAARDPQVGVVVLDVSLSDLSGIEVLRRLRAERPGLRVIVLSAHSDEDLVLEALRLDASDYLAKPLHDEELVLAVRRALGAFDVESSWQRLRERVGRLGARLGELVDGEVARGDDRAAFGALAAEAASAVLGASKTSLMAFDADAEELRVVGAVGSGLAPEEMDPVAPGEGVAGFALGHGEPVVVDDVYLDARFADRALHDRYESSSLAVVPLLRDGVALGVLCATDRGDGAPFGDDDVTLMKILALPAAAFLARRDEPLDLLEDLAGADPEGEPPALETGLEDEPARSESAPEEERTGSEAGLEDGAPGPGIGSGADAHEPDTEPVRGSAEAEDTPGPPAAAAEESGAELAAERDAELAREICEVMTVELEPERLLGGALEAVARRLGGEPMALHLIDNASGELVLETLAERGGVGDRGRLPRDRGLTGVVLQTGSLVATDHPERDPRFDPEVDTAADGAPRPFLCVPLRLRGKVLGLFRGFPDQGAGAAAGTGEILAAALSAAVRNVLLYRSLLESIDEVADARREADARIRR